MCGLVKGPKCGAAMKPLKLMTASLNAGTIRDLIDLAFVLVKGKHKSHDNNNNDLHGHGDYDCAIVKRQIRWYAFSFLPILCLSSLSRSST